MTPFTTARDIAASPEAIFAAFADAERLARWWGPAGFTNTFEVCEFQVGGQWKYTMHGPDGQDFPNESVFREIDPPQRLVIEHFNPDYVLTITLEPLEGGTRVGWEQTFENDNLAQRIAGVIVPANKQNLDKLTAEVLGDVKA